jgi:hypothetical protein
MIFLVGHGFEKGVLENFTQVTDDSTMINDCQGLVVLENAQIGNGILEHFVKFKKPICLIGSGTQALLDTRPITGDWIFRDYCITCVFTINLAAKQGLGSL